MKSSLKPERLLLARCPRVEWEVLDYAARTSFAGSARVVDKFVLYYMLDFLCR
jgi:hypothetical protein